MNQSISINSKMFKLGQQLDDNFKQKNHHYRLQHIFESQQTHSGSMNNKKYIKVTTNSQKKPLPYYKKIKLQNFMSRNDDLKMNESLSKNKRLSICECIEGLGLGQKLDFGITRNKRKVSLQKKIKIIRQNTPVNKLTELIDEDPYPIHHLQSNKKK